MRSFYAIEAIKGTWSVSELKRQINSLLFERSAISKKPELLIQQINQSIPEATTKGLIKDLYTFEFLGLPSKDAVHENELEKGLLDHLQEFILELGHGFCFEGRQKRILIGDEYFHIDLVFYHRILKCHVLIELKVGEFSHNNAGQLNTYLNYYKSEMTETTDKDPIGILLVTNKNETLVEYTIAGMDEKMFVREYMLQLPDKETIADFIKEELRNI
jgi:predicted nuclease of restriction endonuclease-like (RecB) superfamily